jgi:transposase
MNVQGKSIQYCLSEARKVLSSDTTISASVRVVMELMIFVIEALSLRVIGRKSKTSSTAPSQDPNREKTKPAEKKGREKLKPGGQNGHKGNHLEPVEHPDEVVKLSLDRRKVRLSPDFRCVGYEKRQVFDIAISVHVVEYQAEVWENGTGDRVVAEFPSEVTSPTQYGPKIKAHAVYNSVAQYLSSERGSEYFSDISGFRLSEGSIFNFKKKAYELLAPFEEQLINHLKLESLIHNDETGININSKQHWIHSTSSPHLTLYIPHKKRGYDATFEIGILPVFRGFSMHDGWVSYFKYKLCKHVLCNAHHLRELEALIETTELRWPKTIKRLLLKAHSEVTKLPQQKLSPRRVASYHRRFSMILRVAHLECPAAKKDPHKKGKVKQTKARNLLLRLEKYQKETLAFIEHTEVPFTNNLAERDIRMAKLQQKVSGLFKTLEGARIFCRIRSYLSTCRKNGINPITALTALFTGRLQEILLQIFKLESQIPPPQEF